MRFLSPKNPTDEDVLRAFEHWYIPEPNSGCWLWLGNTFKRGGYGAFSCGQNIIMQRAHRMSWLLYKGSTEGLHVLHSCDNRLCVNPEHLWLGTQADNMHDKSLKGRQLQGKNSPAYKHGLYIGDKKNPEYP